MASEPKRSKIEFDKNESLEISTVEMHTGGEPLRIITSGYPEIKGDTLLAKRKYVKENLDHIRKLLMCEPRGHSEMYGALLVTPDDEKADLAVLFMHNGGYSVMCGHAVIALGRYAIDSGSMHHALVNVTLYPPPPPPRTMLILLDISRLLVMILN